MRSMRDERGIAHPYLLAGLFIVVLLFLLVVLGVLLFAFLLAPFLLVGVLMVAGGAMLAVAVRGWIGLAVGLVLPSRWSRANLPSRLRGGVNGMGRGRRSLRRSLFRSPPRCGTTSISRE